MSDLKSGLQRLFNELKGLEERARKLKNQNLADIAASAHGRVKQLVDHPDLELVDEKKDRTASVGSPAYGAPDDMPPLGDSRPPSSFPQVPPKQQQF